MELTDSMQLTKVLLLIVLVMFCSATDLSMRRVPNAVLFPALMTALFLNSLAGGLPGLADSVAGLAIGLLMLMPLYILGRIGAGDLKLLGVVGSVLGAWGAIVAGLATMIAGGVLAVLYLIWLLIRPGVVARILPLVYFITRKDAAPGDAMSLQTVRSAEIPYAVAIAAGTFATLIYLGLLNGASIT
ncbi:MAG: prepilin peptidase [Woeseia sp.]